MLLKDRWRFMHVCAHVWPAYLALGIHSVVEPVLWRVFLLLLEVKLEMLVREVNVCCLKCEVGDGLGDVSERYCHSPMVILCPLLSLRARKAFPAFP